uniref:Capsule synthesis protein CapA domain-containing protein n=1 Tax=Haptolina brevifila TaxID=156173 RepID=A0A7S2MBU2_9EUKA|mmetsp:Transcript_4867/g.10318  ORF Transcript_4867/g.10318 Transcript_4867/m.10318 type:complete len:352 (+) Transcript_4867:57-1112(+)
MAARLRRQGRGRELVLGFGGDVNLGGCIDQSLPHNVPDATSRAAARRLQQRHPLLQRGMRTAEVWGDCVGDLQAHLTAVSLVSPFTLHAQRSRAAGGGLKPETQRSHPLNVEALVDANIDFVSLANGHSLDFREDGLFDTWEALAAAGVAHAGAGEDASSALKPVVLRALGRRIAFFAVSAAGCGLRDAGGQEMWAADERRTGVAFFDLWDERLHAEHLRELGEAVRRTREAQRVTLVVVSVCWGSVGADGRPLASGAVPPAMSAFAHGLVDVAGAQLVHGHGVGHVCSSGQGDDSFRPLPLSPPSAPSRACFSFPLHEPPLLPTPLAADAWCRGVQWRPHSLLLWQCPRR